MAEKTRGAAVALVASAALAPVTLPPEAEVTDHGDGTATVTVPGPSPDEWLSRVAELNTELDEVKASAALLADELTLERTRTESLRAELAETRARFNAAWDDREREVAALLNAASAPAPAAPAPVDALASRFYAVGSIRCHLRGAPITIDDGAVIPDGVDLTTIPAGAIRKG